jgi:hypothetical protein
VDFLVEEEATSSTPQAPNHPVPGTAAMHAAQQYTAAQTSRTPSRAAPGALSAARELLCHPQAPRPHRGAIKQWHDDVDRLLGMVHSGSTRSRPRSSWRQHEATASVQSPSVRGAQTNDLWAELNRRRAGEDARVSLERVRERLENFEGREDARVSLERAREPSKHRGSQPRSRLCYCSTTYPNGCPDPGGCPIGRRGLRHARGSSPRDDMAPQVPAAPAGKVRRYVQPVGILVGVLHRHYGSRWRHRRNGNIFSCFLVWACPDLAHEPYFRINLLLGRAMREVCSELRQFLSAAWRGGSPPCSEAGVRGNSLDLHLPLHQGTRDYTPYLRRFHHQRLLPGGA